MFSRGSCCCSLLTSPPRLSLCGTKLRPGRAPVRPGTFISAATRPTRASAAVWSCGYAAGAWPTGQRRAWLCPNCCRQTAARLTLTIARPLLDLVVIAMVREQWLVGFLVPVAHYAARTRMRCFRMIDCSSSRLRRSSSSSICGDDGKKCPGYSASISGSRLGERRSFSPKTARA
jgi:hypothetical protein